MTKEEQFDVFWKAYPNKKAKSDAQKAFAKAIKKTTLETMLEAIKAYKLHKPEWQSFRYPATWLNSGSWDDEWAPKTAFGGAPATSRAEYIKAELARAERSWH